MMALGALIILMTVLGVTWGGFVFVRRLYKRIHALEAATTKEFCEPKLDDVDSKATSKPPELSQPQTTIHVQGNFNVVSGGSVNVSRGVQTQTQEMFGQGTQQQTQSLVQQVPIDEFNARLSSLGLAPPGHKVGRPEELAKELRDRKSLSAETQEIVRKAVDSYFMRDAFRWATKLERDRRKAESDEYVMKDGKRYRKVRVEPKRR